MKKKIILGFGIFVSDVIFNSICIFLRYSYMTTFNEKDYEDCKLTTISTSQPTLKWNKRKGKTGSMIFIKKS